MASKSAKQEPEPVDVEETLDVIDKTVERVKSLYEQYFLGIQKQPPTFLHTDLERKLRDLSQVQIRNTALRYRFVTLQQKFGSYHAYWRRTIRQIENGTYLRSLQKIGRKAAQTGDEIPEEILAAMPKRMREQVRRDREAAVAIARRREQLPAAGEGDFYEEYDRPAPVAKVDARGAHVLDAADADLDLDEYFRQVADETAEPTHSSAPPQPPEPEPFENVVTPPRATPTPPAPTPPAPVRASTLGFGPRPTSSPNLKAQNRATDPVPLAASAPPTNPESTPPSFRPTGNAPTPPASRPAFRKVDTVPGTGPTPRGATEPGPGTPPSATPPSFRPPAITPGQPPTRPSTIAGQPGQPARPVPGQPAAGQPAQRTSSMPAIPQQRTGSMPAIPQRTGSMPAIPQRTGSMPAIPQPKGMTEADQSVVGARPLGRPPGTAPSQDTRPTPVMAGVAATVKPATVETLTGPFAREPAPAQVPRRAKRDTDVDGGVDVPMEPTPRPSQPAAVQRPSAPGLPRSVPAIPPMRPTPNPVAQPPTPTPNAQRPTAPRQPNQAVAGRTPNTPGAPVRRTPPPGMTDDDVNTLYAKYVKAKEMVGETTGPQTYGKLLNTINAQAPKIMEQYKAKGVDFSVVVKDNQVIIRAKPKP